MSFSTDSRGLRWVRRELARAAAWGTLLRSEMEDGRAGRPCGPAAQGLSWACSPCLECRPAPWPEREGCWQSYQNGSLATRSPAAGRARPRPLTPRAAPLNPPRGHRRLQPGPALLARLEPILFQVCALPGANQKGDPWRREASLRDGRPCWPITVQTGRLRHTCSTQ